MTSGRATMQAESAIATWGSRSTTAGPVRSQRVDDRQHERGRRRGHQHGVQRGVGGADQLRDARTRERRRRRRPATARTQPVRRAPAAAAGRAPGRACRPRTSPARSRRSARNVNVGSPASSTPKPVGAERRRRPAARRARPAGASAPAWPASGRATPPSRSPQVPRNSPKPPPGQLPDQVILTQIGGIMKGRFLRYACASLR